MSLLTLAVFSGIRFNAGYDYPVYYELIRKDDYDWFEPLSRVLMDIGHKTDPIVFFALSSLLIAFFYYLAFDRYSRIHQWHPVGIFAFLGLPIAYLDSLGVIRQFVAIAIFVYVASNINRNTLHSLAWLLVAALFHKSITILLPLVLLRRFLSTPRTIFIYLALWTGFLGIGSLIIATVSLYTGLYSSYFTLHLSSSGFKIYILLSLIFVYFLANRRLLFENGNHIFLFNCYFLGILLFSAALPFGIHISRISWALLAVHPLLFGVILARKPAADHFLFVAACTAIMSVSIFLAYKNPERDFLNQYQPFFAMDKYQRDFIIEKSLQTEIQRED
ncbi:EpsG family protein [Alcaligenes sp. WGS1538]|uniref:EpsG family protein n=1 Tax=Alcaligenes sp. WGS1538 TaxID=3366811 RepID=UPI00372D79B1